MGRFFLVIVLCALSLPLIPVARAQDSNDLQPLMDRLDRLERDMNVLQRQVYRGAGANGAPVVSGANGGGGGNGALNDELRMSQLGDQMRELTGKVEELSYNFTQLKQQLDRLSSDIDVRFQQLGQGGGAASGEPSVASDGSAGGPPSGGFGGPPPGRVGQNGAPVLTPPGAPGHAAAGPSSGVLPAGSAQEQYNYAFGLLRQANYPAAEQALHSFVQKYPKDPLAGNAQYWLGETYYVRKDYTHAAAAFAEDYEKYPKGPKAPDDLLKLGMALGNLGQKANACRAYGQLNHDFPGAGSAIKGRLASERQRLGC